MARLGELKRRHAVIGEVRGKGLMIGMELVKDQATRTPAKDLCDALITRAYHHGLLLLSCGASTYASCRRCWSAGAGRRSDLVARSCAAGGASRVIRKPEQAREEAGGHCTGLRSARCC
jgi:hypothetical protein